MAWFQPFCRPSTKSLKRNKLNNHSRLSTLAAAKHDTIRAFVSQALDDNRVSDAQFKHITHEMKRYDQMKGTLRSKYPKKQSASPVPDIEKIKDEIREEFRKQIAATSAALN